MWYLILKLWKSFDNESLLLFLMHRWWRLTLDLKRVNKCLANIKFVLLSVCPVYEALLALTYLTPLSLELFYLFMPSGCVSLCLQPSPCAIPNSGGPPATSCTTTGPPNRAGLPSGGSQDPLWVSAWGPGQHLLEPWGQGHRLSRTRAVLLRWMC